MCLPWCVFDLVILFMKMKRIYLLLICSCYRFSMIVPRSLELNCYKNNWKNSHGLSFMGSVITIFLSLSRVFKYWNSSPVKITIPFTLGFFPDWDSKFETFFIAFLKNYFKKNLLHYHKTENSEKRLNLSICNYSKILGYLKIRAWEHQSWD